MAGVLPSLHTVTEHIMVQYEDRQTMTLYVMINFETNCFQLKAAINQRNVGLQPTKEEWKWLAEMDLDIVNFHIKCAFIFQNKLVIFSRGQPKDITEVCCSFLLVFDLEIDSNVIKAINPEYKYVKLDSLTYAEF